jgi:Protein of unknown function (DUF1592)/Protein of unknown function (DUF1588)/Protein of unknown function (DUF1595)/Protein of unknown function (DUF1587)/Protein of unknown function (DUF1585)
MRKLFLPMLLAACLWSLAGQEDFTRNVYPALEKAGCRSCHNVDGVASATRLHFPDEDASPARIEAFGKSLVALVDREHPAQSLLLNKPTLRIPHTGGKRIPPGTPEEKALQGWVNYLVKMSPAEAATAIRAGRPETAQADGAPVLRRLTHSQYNHTIFDLLGDESNPADQFPPEDFVNGYKGQYQSQAIGPLLEEAYSAAAEKIARSAFRGGDARGIVSCKPSGPADAVCRTKFIREFGLRVFRRPVSETEAARYGKLFASEAAAQRDFYKGAQVTLEAMLQSPAFLFRVESPADPKLRPYEAASRLSYFIWDSMPDQALFRAAAAGELNSRAGIEKTAQRMLADPKARRAVDQFVSEWLRFDRVITAVKERRAFPMFTPELALAMAEESRRLVHDAVWNDRNFLDIFSANYAFVNSDLAALYSLPAPAGEFERVEFPANTDRAGITGAGAFLVLTSKPGETSPTARGLFVREQFLCQHVPDPPPGVNTNLPPLTEEKPMTVRERLGEHVSNPSCASCHNLIDPIGFGLEHYDAVGRRQEKQRVTVPLSRADRDKRPVSAELPIDSSGRIAGIENSEFSSPKELGRVLAGSAQCQECVVKQLFRYQSGRLETLADREIIRRSFDEFRGSQFRFKRLIIAIAKWTEFPPRREDGRPTE